MIAEIVLVGVLGAGAPGQAGEGNLPPEIHRIGGDVIAPQIRRRVEPEYPAAARRERLEGLVILEAVVTSSGRVDDIKVMQPIHPLQDESAISAVRQFARAASFARSARR
jgi:TonB family protein